MNIIQVNLDSGSWCLTGVRMTPDGQYSALNTFLWPDGSLRDKGQEFVFSTSAEAIAKAKRLAKTKARTSGYVEVSSSELPKKGSVYLCLDIDRYVKSEEMINMISTARHERYVVFKDVTGMNDWFDEGIEYIAFTDLFDSDILHVYDRFGKMRECGRFRFSSVVPTEMAIEVGVEQDAGV